METVSYNEKVLNFNRFIINKIININQILGNLQYQNNNHWKGFVNNFPFLLPTRTMDL